MQNSPMQNAEFFAGFETESLPSVVVFDACNKPHNWNLASVKCRSRMNVWLLWRSSTNELLFDWKASFNTSLDKSEPILRLYNALLHLLAHRVLLLVQLQPPLPPIQIVKMHLCNIWFRLRNRRRRLRPRLLAWRQQLLLLPPQPPPPPPSPPSRRAGKNGNSKCCRSRSGASATGSPR